MMTNDDYQHFVCIVAGNNPDELMKDYDKGKKTEPYLVYRYKDAGKIKANYINYYQTVLENQDSFDITDVGLLKETIQDLIDMDDNEFYTQLIGEDEDNLKFNIDEKSGDAYSTINKNGKWTNYNIGKIFSIPFLTKDGREVFKATKGDIDWTKIHLAGGDIYKRAWEMVMEDSTPENDYEKQIFDNMRDKKTYFEKFETKENYILSNTAFWGYAFLSDVTGWQDAEGKDQFTWMANFYDMFIKNLADDTLLTIFECTK